MLQLNGVRDACCKFLLSQLDPSNCLGIRGFADTHSCSDLLKSAHKYVLQHFVEVSKTEEFMLLPLKQVGGFALVGGIHDKSFIFLSCVGDKFLFVFFFLKTDNEVLSIYLS